MRFSRSQPSRCFCLQKTVLVRHQNETPGGTNRRENIGSMTREVQSESLESNDVCFGRADLAGLG